MRRIKTMVVVLAAACWLVSLAGCAPEGVAVFQGICVSYDAKTHKLVLKNTEPAKNKVPKTMASVTFDTAKAQVGLLPAPGDKIRVSYLKKGNVFEAHKVMNVSKQDLRKK